VAVGVVRCCDTGHDRGMDLHNWPPGPGVVELPDGVRVRGRGLRRGSPETVPDWGVVLLGRPAPPFDWPTAWVQWPDFALPIRWREAHRVLVEAHERAGQERVEIVCGGGRGRTGTALACLATMAGLSSGEAVHYVKSRYDPGAVEAPWQRLFVVWFRTQLAGIDWGVGMP
jgi:hypothetical protein